MKRKITSIVVDVQYGGGVVMCMHRDESKDTHVVRTYRAPTLSSLRRAHAAQLALAKGKSA